MVLFKVFLGVTVVIAMTLLLGWLLYKIKRNKLFHRRVQAWQPFIAVGFLAALCVCVIFSTSYYYKNFISDPVTVMAKETLPLFNSTFIATSIAFFLTQSGIFYFAFRYRQKPESKAAPIKGNSKLEILWTLLPAFVFVFLFLWGQILWAKIVHDPSDNALQIEITGQQFSWFARYPGRDGKLGRGDFRLIDNVNEVGIDLSDPASQDDVMPIQMHIPKGRAIKLLLRSKDVIHSFYIPHFGVKMDAVPGMITTLAFTATSTTEEMREKLNDSNFNYEVACAELCGRMHFAMKMIVVVDAPDEYEKWSHQQISWTSSHTKEKSL